MEIINERYQDLSDSNQKLTNRYNELEKKFWNLKNEKSTQEQILGENLKNMEESLLEKKREMDNFQINLFTEKNLEFEKIKLQNQIEVNFSKKLIEKEDLILALKERVGELEGENSVQNRKILSIEKENKNANQVLRKNHQKQIDSLLDEISSLQMRMNLNSKQDELRHLIVKNEQLNNKNEQLEKRLLEIENELDQAQSKKNQIMSENIEEIQKLRNELNKMILEKDGVEIENREIMSENNELETENKNLERDLLAEKETNHSLEKILEEKKRIIVDLEADIGGVKEIQMKEILQLNKDYSQREENKNEKNLQLTRELNLKTKECERIKELYQERIDGINASNLAYQKKSKKSYEEKNSLLSNLKILNDSLKQQKIQNLKLVKELEDLRNETVESKLRLKEVEKEVKIYKKYEEEGKILTDNQAEELKINEKLILQTKKLKIENLKLKKIIKKLNKKLVEAISKKVINAVNTQKSAQTVYKEGIETKGRIYDPFPIQSKHEMPYEYPDSIPSNQNNIFTNPKSLFQHESQRAPSFGQNGNLNLTDQNFNVTDSSFGKSQSEKSVRFNLGGVEGKDVRVGRVIENEFKNTLDDPGHPFHRAYDIEGLDKKYVNFYLKNFFLKFF